MRSFEGLFWADIIETPLRLVGETLMLVAGIGAWLLGIVKREDSTVTFICFATSLFIAVVIVYLHAKAAWRRERVEAEKLNERLKPRLQIGPPVVLEATTIDIYNNNAPTGTAAFVQVPVSCLTEAPVEECRGWTVKVWKQNGSRWEETTMNESLQLYWSNTYVHPPEAITLHPGIPINLNILNIWSKDGKIRPQVFGEPTRTQGVFNSNDTFRMDIAVSAPKGGVTVPASLIFKLGSQWNKPEVVRLDGA